MTDLVELESILSLLKKHNVSRFKKAGLEIEFQPITLTTDSHISSPPVDIEIPVDDSHLPPDLKGDDLFNYDKVLNWSGSPDEEAGMPLTDDLPLTSP